VREIKKSLVAQAEQDETQNQATASGSRKQLALLVLAVVAVNLFLFLKFGLQRKPSAALPTTGTNSPTAITNANVQPGNRPVGNSVNE
jgi:hypothetical protein